MSVGKCDICGSVRSLRQKNNQNICSECKDKAIQEGLLLYLRKCEIEYIATHGGGYPITFNWSDNVEEQIKVMGFKIKERYESDGEWIRTTSNISIFLQDGFVIKDNG